MEVACHFRFGNSISQRDSETPWHKLQATDEALQTRISSASLTLLRTYYPALPLLVIHEVYRFAVFPFGAKKNHEMGNSAVKATETKVEGEKKLKPCCACPETKKIRDTCIIEKGEAECGHLIEAHKACMRHLGFNI